MRIYIFMSALIVFVVSVISVTAEAAKKECEYFVEVKTNPKEYRNFMAHFNYALNMPLMLYGDYIRQNEHLSKPYVVNGKEFRLDKMTIACMRCHSAVLGVKLDQSGNEIIERNLHDTSGKHALGLDYHERVIKQPDRFRKPDPKRNNIIFVGGKLGCVSCHNPFSNLPYNLNVLTEGNALCKQCHIR